jgi:hypothetical protein
METLLFSTEAGLVVYVRIDWFHPGTDIDIHTVDWRDQARDILQLLSWYLLDEVSTQAAPPLHLLRVDESTALRRQEHGFESRTIVGAGHGVGAVGT